MDFLECHRNFEPLGDYIRDMAILTETRRRNGVQNVTGLRGIVARNLRFLAAYHRVSQTELAQALGLSQPAISRRLRGATALDTDDMERAARAFGVDPADLLREIGPEGLGTWCAVRDSNPEPAGLVHVKHLDPRVSRLPLAA